MTAMGRQTAEQTSANTIYGMIIVAFATALVCTCGAIAQYHGGSILQLMLGSYIMQNLIAWAWWCIRKPSQAVHWYGDSPFKFNIWTRGVLYWVMMFCWWKGLEMVPIGDAEAILFISPLLTVLVARFLLKETLPRLFPLTVIITLVGLVFICQPGFIFDSDNVDYSEISWVGMIFLVVCIFCWSGSSLLVRTAKEAHWLQVNIVTSFQAAWMWTPIAAIINHFWWSSVGQSSGGGNGTPASNSHTSTVSWIDQNDFGDWDWSPYTILVMMCMAFFEFFGIMCKVVGYQLGEATKVAWMEYLDIVFAFLFQWFLFRREPNAWEYVGATLLMASCIIHFCEEKYFGSRNSDNIQTQNEKDSIELNDAENESLLQETRAISDPSSKNDNKNNKYGSINWVNMSINGSLDDNDVIKLNESSHTHIDFNGDIKNNNNIQCYKDSNPKQKQKPFVL